MSASEAVTLRARLVELECRLEGGALVTRSGERWRRRALARDGPASPDEA